MIDNEGNCYDEFTKTKMIDR